jgi:7-cyano-7-deazaguanine synthase
MPAESPSSAVVLLSAGLDSTFNLLKTLEQFKVALALTFNYGQRAAAKEIAFAAKIAKHFKVPHKVVELPWFKDFAGTTLINRDGRVPSGAEVQIDDLERSKETAKAVWVPNRNGIFLNIAAGFAEGLGARFVIPGFNLEEARTFPDNSDAYLKALDESFSFSTQNRVHTHCYSAHLDKSQIVKEGRRLDLPFHLLWPCYQDQEKWCGACESCQRFKRALKANGLEMSELQ